MSGTEYMFKNVCSRKPAPEAQCWYKTRFWLSTSTGLTTPQVSTLICIPNNYYLFREYRLNLYEIFYIDLPLNLVNQLLFPSLLFLLFSISDQPLLPQDASSSYPGSGCTRPQRHLSHTGRLDIDTNYIRQN